MMLYLYLGKMLVLNYSKRGRDMELKWKKFINSETGK